MRRGIRLGVDVGAVRVGVATCDPEGILATPVETVPRMPEGEADLDRLAALADENDVLEIVVGLPRSLSGADGPAAMEARHYALRLARKVHPRAVRLVDERLTTVDAQRMLRDAGRSSRSERTVIDQLAAVLILQTALDFERSGGLPPGEAVVTRKPRHKRGPQP